MKILAIGDFHGKFSETLKKEAKNADLILCTGDFGGSDRFLKVIFKYFGEKWWEIVGIKKAKQYIFEDYNSGKKMINELDSLGKPVYTIMGNWDFNSKSNFERIAKLNLKKYQEIIRKTKNIKYWARGIKNVNGLNILAFGGMVTAKAYLEKGNRKEKVRKKFIRKNRKEVKQIMSYGDKNIDILFAHYPPYNFFDIVRFKGHNPMNGKHVGFEGYTKYIKKYQPKLFICGHMHEYQGIKRLGKTKIIATGAAHEGKAAIIEFDKGKVKKIKFIK
ncbi:MAG: metallophosphoesterase [Candidatus Pacearchaeota archaeon]|nr:metallophosphoesterase [Candidatus Pacearchaeota archaeon]